MGSKYWIKLYHEILADPKMGRLPDRTWRRCIELFLLAGETDDNGQLPSIDDIAWTLRVDRDELISDMEALEAVDILSRDEDGNWNVTKFTERQDPDTPKERAERYRERKQISNAPVTQPSRNVAGVVTKPVLDTDTDKIRIDKDKDKDTEQETDGASADVVVVVSPFALYESEKFGPVTEKIKDHLNMLIDEFSEPWVSDALVKASLANKRNLAYVKGILKNWDAGGKDAPKDQPRADDYKKYKADAEKWGYAT